MIKYVKSNNGINLKKIYSGISIDVNKDVRFNWDIDKPNDVLSLTIDTSGEFNSDGIRYIYGYVYNTNDKSKQKIVRDYLKYSMSNPEILVADDIYRFVENSVLGLNERCPLKDFSALIYPAPKSEDSLVSLMCGYLSEYMECLQLTSGLIKKTYLNVQFDEEKAYDMLVANGVDADFAENIVEDTSKRFRRMQIKQEPFEMKKFNPRLVRYGFSNFLKFGSEAEKRVYESLQGVDTLIFDDFYTSGATVKEMVRYLKAINNKNTLTVFVLVKQ